MNFKKFLIGGVAGVLMLGAITVGAFAANGGGFNEFGYNYTARVFNGTGSSWCLEQGDAADCLGIYYNDKLVMKWNAAWDACNASQTAANCQGAWINNEWNGKVPNGSGQIWHYKIVWNGACSGNNVMPDGGYCLWGPYEVLMDQGTDPNVGPGHMWLAHAIPNGYGVSK